MAAGAARLKKPCDIVKLSFCEGVKGQPKQGWGLRGSNLYYLEINNLVVIEK